MIVVDRIDYEWDDKGAYKMQKAFEKGELCDMVQLAVVRWLLFFFVKFVLNFLREDTLGIRMYRIHDFDTEIAHTHSKNERHDWQ